LGVLDSLAAEVDVSAVALSAASAGTYGAPLWRVENFLRKESSRVS